LRSKKCSVASTQASFDNRVLSSAKAHFIAGRHFPAGLSHACYSRYMAEVITQRELRNESGEIMRRLDQGEAFIVTRNGVPVGELIPLRRRRFVGCDTVADVFAHAPVIDPNRFRDDLDSYATQDIEPRA
jgi:prevent-host-death family protein